MNFENLPLVILTSAIYVGVCIFIVAFIKFLKTPNEERLPEPKPAPKIISVLIIIGALTLGFWKLFVSESNIAGIIIGSIWLLTAFVAFYKLVKDVSNKKT